jgi:hypothetical protein
VRNRRKAILGWSRTYEWLIAGIVRPSNTADALDRDAIVLLDRNGSYPSVAGSSRRRPPEEIELGCLIRTRRDEPD